MVIPALNEANTVGSVAARVPRTIAGIARVDVLVVDDGSSDATATVATEAGAMVLKHAHQRGVGAVFHSALGYFVERGADFIVTIDGDGQFDPEDIPTLLEPALAGTADFVTASRFKDPELVPTMPRSKIWGNKMMSWLISRLTGQRYYDVSCGFRCYNKRAALCLHLLGEFTYTQEVFLNLSVKHMRIVERPLTVRGERAFGESRVASSLLRYGWRASKITARCYRDFFPMRFFGALALILAVAAAALGSFLLVHYLRSGNFSPHKWAGFCSAALGFLAVASLHLGMVGDILTRHRLYLEELLYRQRMQWSGSGPACLEPETREWAPSEATAEKT